MHDTIIEAHGLKRYYRRGSETVKALDGVDLSIRSGEIVSILGPSGSGKTTLINLLSCLDAPTEGTLFVAGKSVAGLSEDELVEVQARCFGICVSTILVVADADGFGERRAPANISRASNQCTKDG